MPSIGDLEKRIDELERRQANAEKECAEKFGDLKLMAATGLRESAAVAELHERLLEKLTRTVLDGVDGADSLMTKGRLSEKDRENLWEEIRRLKKVNELRAEDEKNALKERRSSQLAILVAVIGGICGIAAAIITAIGAIFGGVPGH